MITWQYSLENDSPSTPDTQTPAGGLNVGSGLVRDLRLDDDKDLYVGGGDLSLVAGVEAAKQGAEIRCAFFQGDWFLDLDAGIPYWTRILIKNPNLVEVREWFRLNILDTPDITAVDSIYLVYRVDRSLRVAYRARASTGQTITAEGQPS